MVHPSQQQPRYLIKRPAWSVTMRRGTKVRTFTVRPAIVGSVFGCLAILLVAYVGATAYLVYRDDLMGAAVSRQVSMQYAYEERISALRQELDRLTSRHVVQTENVEQQLATLLEQQELIQSRQSALDELVAKARDAGLDVATSAPQTAPAAASQTQAPAQDGPSQDQVGPLSYAAPEADPADPITGLLMKPPRKAAEDAEHVRPMLAKVSDALDTLEAKQSASLDALNIAAEGTADRISAALMPLGVEVTADEESEAQGGPFIPTAGLHFVERTAILKRTLDDIQSLRQAAKVIPLGVPVTSTHVSSGFGYRLDPFLKRPAFHSGLDFVASAGTPVRATAPGVVAFAGWNGGYGQMVEIKHADGVSTRYGHMSAILVSAGQSVDAGTTIGRVGSTGRSTGPHVHYETRRDGEAVNPTIYLTAGRVLRDGS